MKHLITILLALLFVVHHDVWNWDNRNVVLGVLPVGLAYHLGFSVVAAATWWAATRWLWPKTWEDWAEENGEQP